MLEGFSLDPHTVLGIPRDASPEEVREAFRRKSLKHHPDHGGDDWAFRIVLRAYRALAAPAEDEPATAPAEGPPATPPGLVLPRGARWGDPRAGLIDKETQPQRRVRIEMGWVQTEFGDVMALLNASQAERQLGGWLRLSWPDPGLPGDPQAIPFADRILLALNAAFDEARARPGAVTGRSHIEGGRFSAWLSYPGGSAARDAFRYVHHSLKARGLGVRQTTRLVTIPRITI